MILMPVGKLQPQQQLVTVQRSDIVVTGESDKGTDTTMVAFVIWWYDCAFMEVGQLRSDEMLLELGLALTDCCYGQG